MSTLPGLNTKLDISCKWLKRPRIYFVGGSPSNFIFFICKEILTPFLSAFPPPHPLCHASNRCDPSPNIEFQRTSKSITHVQTVCSVNLTWSLQIQIQIRIQMQIQTQIQIQIQIQRSSYANNLVGQLNPVISSPEVSWRIGGDWKPIFSLTKHWRMGTHYIRTHISFHTHTQTHSHTIEWRHIT